MVGMALDALLARMQDGLVRLDGDRRRYFHATYLRTTRAVAAEIERDGFLDSAWVTRWDLAFADFYLDALDADLAGRPVSAPWRVAFDTAGGRADMPPLRHVLLGMNAHINYDLPQALLAVIGPVDFDDPRGVLSRRRADHRHVDDVLLARITGEEAELARLSPPRRRDRLLRPLNRAATARLLVEARRTVWHNAVVLDRARRAGADTYHRLLAELERRCADRLTELTAPGPVLLRLARRGFGVRLGGRPPTGTTTSGPAWPPAGR